MFRFTPTTSIWRGSSFWTNDLGKFQLYLKRTVLGTGTLNSNPVLEKGHGETNVANVDAIGSSFNV
jgi:hypothetical protein